MISAECKLVPIPAADYVEKNPPVSRILDNPVYYVGFLDTLKKATYIRAWRQLQQLFTNYAEKQRSLNAKKLIFLKTHYLKLRQE